MLIEGQDRNNKSSHVEIKEGQMAVVTLSPSHKAAIKGDAYTWNAVSDANIGATDCALSVRNLSPNRLLVISRIYIYSDVPTAIDVWLTTSSTAYNAGAAGAAVVGINLNTSSNKVADADGYSDDDDVGPGTIICTLHSNEAAGTQSAIDFPTNDAIILGTNGCVGVDLVTDAAVVECTITGYFIDA